MRWPLLAAAVWALAATFTAFLPMRMQFPLGIFLLLIAPVILIWVGVTVGLLWALLGLAGFVSMFRKPMIYFARKAIGQDRPDDGAAP